MIFTSLMEEKFSGLLLLDPVPATEMSVAVMLSMVILLARTRFPWETKLPLLKPPGAGTMPGSVEAKLFGLRATGTSRTVRVSSDSCTCALCASNGITASVTTTCSVTWPTSSCRFTVVTSALRTGAVATARRNPADSTVTNVLTDLQQGEGIAASAVARDLSVFPGFVAGERYLRPNNGGSGRVCDEVSNLTRGLRGEHDGRQQGRQQQLLHGKTPLATYHEPAALACPPELRQASGRRGETGLARGAFTGLYSSAAARAATAARSRRPVLT